jgi:hypothetical protein
MACRGLSQIQAVVSVGPPRLVGCVRQVLQKAVTWAGLGGLAELGLLELLEIVHVEISMSLEPIFEGFDGEGSDEAAASV